MAPVDLSETPPSSPSRSPPRKKAKFSLRLKGKSKTKNDQESSDHEKTSKTESFYPIFRSPIQQIDCDTNMEIEPVLPSCGQSGLLNRGNICYANAVLQILRRCPGFEQFVSQLATDLKSLEDNLENGKNLKIEPKTLVTQLSKLLKEMDAYEADFLIEKGNCSHLRSRGSNALVLAVEPLDFMEAFREIYQLFECNLQHDAQEFLCSLIMALQESSNEITKYFKNNPQLSFSSSQSTTESTKNSHKSTIISSKYPQQESVYIKNLFQGKLVHQTKCLNCEQSKLRYEDIQEVSVPVVEDQPYVDARKKMMLSPTPKKTKADPHTLQWAISQFASSECLQGDNKYFCENCKTYCEARISTCFESLPGVLTVHLKRFTSSIGFSSKITSNLKTPLCLSVEEWCSKKCESKSNIYELFGVVLHSGLTSGSGHYEAYVRSPDQQKELHGNGNINTTESDKLCKDKLFETAALANGDSSSNSVDAASNPIDTKSDDFKDVYNINIEAIPVNSTVDNLVDNVLSDNKDSLVTENKAKGSFQTTLSDTKANTKTVLNSEDQKEVDVNQNCVDKSDKMFPEKVSKRILRPRKRKSKNLSSDLSTEESSKESDENEKPKAKLGLEKEALVNDKSPLTPSRKPSCMSLITKYFQKARKHSETSNKQESEKSSNKMENSTNDWTFKKATVTKPSTIRKLDFVNNGNSQKSDDNEFDSQKEEESKLFETAGNNWYPERLKKNWLHFDDCTVYKLVEKDIMDVLSASESSFMSPYLLFYQKTENSM